jgi:hypothetical protein
MEKRPTDVRMRSVGRFLIRWGISNLSKLYALEPNPGMIRLADRQRRQTALQVEFLDLPGERIPLVPEIVKWIETR